MQAKKNIDFFQVHCTLNIISTLLFEISDKNAIFLTKKRTNSLSWSRNT